MNLLLKFLTTILISTTVIGQSKSSQTLIPQVKVEQKHNTDTLKLKAIIGTLNIKKDIEKNEAEQSRMPWVVALIIGILTVGINFYISYINQKTSIRNIDAQITTSTFASKNQIDASKEIALQQIGNSQKLAILEVNAKLKMQNRQEWVTDMRHTLSEFTTQSKLFNVEIQEEVQDKTRNNILHEKVTYNRMRLSLLLNPAIPLHKELLNSIAKLLEILDHHMAESEQSKNYDNLDFINKNEAVITDGRKLLYSEWQKIQKVEFD